MCSSDLGQMQTRNEDNFVYNVDEKISSAYLQANIKADRLRGNVGVRFVRTKQHADSTDQVENYKDYFFNGPNGTPAPCQAGGAPAAGAGRDGDGGDARRCAGAGILRFWL